MEPLIREVPRLANVTNDISLTTQLQQELRSNGFAIIRGLLTPQEAKSLRPVVRRSLKANGRYLYGGKFQLHAMYTTEEVARFLTSDVILARLKEITDPLEVVLTGECDLMINTTSSWHNDVPHHPRCKDGSIFADDTFRVYKIAFYLQDQGDDSPATLKVRPRSHLKGVVDSLPARGLGVKAGDAIIFDVRIEHAGQMPTFVDRSLRRICELVAPPLHLDAQMAFTLSRAILRRIAFTQDRVAVFMTFGPAEEQTYSYADEGRLRHPGTRGTLSTEVLAQLSRNNIQPPIIGSPT